MDSTLSEAGDSVRSIVLSSVRVGGALVLVAVAACSGDKGNRRPGMIPQRGGEPRPLASAIADTTEDGQWIMPAHDYASTRFSRLGQITAQNVAGLKVAFTFSTGVNRGHEAAPLVVNNTMYIVTPFPNRLYALDLTKPGAPQKWMYDPAPAAAAQGVACCDLVNRGAMYADGKIVYNTLDGHTVAVDANTGKQVWKARVADYNRGESITMAPLVVRGKVLVGNSGGEFGVRG